MSLFRRALSLDRSAGDDPFDVSTPLPGGPTGETESVRRIAARLMALPPARARYVAAFAYVLGRAASATLAVSEVEATEMARAVAEVGGLDESTALVVVELAGTRASDFGPTEDFLVTREFKAMSTMEDRQRLLRCCLLVLAADDEVDATESWLANRIAEELDIERQDLNRIRAEFHDRLSGIRQLRQLRMV